MERSFFDDVLRVLEKRCQDGVRLRDVAAVLGVSSRTLQRRLAEERVSFAWVLSTYRWYEAAYALASGESVARAARRSGYSAMSHFSVAFRTHFGVTASEFREAARRDRLSWGAIGLANRAGSPVEASAHEALASAHLDAVAAIADKMTTRGREIFEELVESKLPAYAFR